jgi:oligopeptide transport system substrate-binding protein
LPPPRSGRKTWADVKLVNQEWKTFLDTRHQGTYDVARAGWCADYNEPTSFLNTMLSDSSMNTAHYKSPAFDKIMAESVKRLMKRSVLQPMRKQSSSWTKTAIVPVYYYVNARLVKPWVGGYTGKDPMDNIYTKDLTLSNINGNTWGACARSIVSYLSSAKAHARRYGQC